MADTSLELGEVNNEIFQQRHMDACAASVIDAKALQRMGHESMQLFSNPRCSSLHVKPRNTGQHDLMKDHRDIH